MLSASLIQLEYAPKHWKSTFSYSPLVLWWPPLSHFRKKGFFLGLSLVSTSTLKYQNTYSFPHTQKWALTMAGALLLLCL